MSSYRSRPKGTIYQYLCCFSISYSPRVHFLPFCIWFSDWILFFTHRHHVKRNPAGLYRALWVFKEDMRPSMLEKGNKRRMLLNPKCETRIDNVGRFNLSASLLRQMVWVCEVTSKASTMIIVDLLVRFWGEKELVATKSMSGGI